MSSFELNKANVKSIKCVANGVSYDLKKVLDKDGNVLWKALEDLLLSITWEGTTRVDSDTKPDMVATLHGHEVLSYSYGIDYSFYAKVNESDDYTLVDSRTNSGNTVYNFGVPDLNRYYKLELTLNPSTSDDYEVGNVTSELFIDYIKAESPNITVFVDNFFVGESAYISDIISFPDQDIVVTSCSSNITMYYDESNYYGHYMFTLDSVGQAWFKCYYPGDMSLGIQDSDIVTCYFQVRQVSVVTWASNNVYSLGNTVRFTVSNFSSNVASIVVNYATTTGDDMYTVGPATLISGSSSSYVFDLELSVVNQGSHVVDSEAIRGSFVMVDIEYYDASGNIITTSHATTPRVVGYNAGLPDTSDLYYNQSYQDIVEEWSGYIITGTQSAIDAGTYSATLHLITPDMTQWGDGTTADKTITRKILPAYWQATQGNDPLDLEGTGSLGDTIRIRIWDYPNGAAAGVTGFTVYYELWNLDKNERVKYDTVSVDASSYGNLVIDTGVYASYGPYCYKNTIVYANGSNFASTSGLNSNSITFKSWSGYATQPTVSGSGTYGDTFSKFISGGSNVNLFIAGNAPTSSGAVAPVGTYDMYAAPVAGYRWSGTTAGTEKRYVGTITIAKATIYESDFPTGQQGTYSSGDLIALDIVSGSSQYTIEGVISQKNAGSYSYTVTPKSNYQWDDGTTAAKTFDWSIGPANQATPTVEFATLERGSNLVVRIGRSPSACVVKGKLLRNSKADAETATVKEFTITFPDHTQKVREYDLGMNPGSSYTYFGFRITEIKSTYPSEETPNWVTWTGLVRTGWKYLAS